MQHRNTGTRTANGCNRHAAGLRRVPHSVFALAFPVLTIASCPVSWPLVVFFGLGGGGGMRSGGSKGHNLSRFERSPLAHQRDWSYVQWYEPVG